MKLSRFLKLFLIAPLFSQCQNVHYSKIGTEGGPAYMTINSNHTYEYLWYRYYDLGPIDDTIFHRGKWEKSGDTLILNSNNRPSNYQYIEEEETMLQNDSTNIFITSSDTIPFLFFAPKQIRINDNYYSTKFFNDDSIELAIPRTEVKYIVIPGYPIYYPKKKTSNYFHLSIKDLSSEKFEYSGGTYFLDEKFLMKTGSLYQLWNNEKQVKFLKMK